MAKSRRVCIKGAELHAGDQKPILPYIFSSGVGVNHFPSLIFSLLRKIILIGETATAQARPCVFMLIERHFRYLFSVSGQASHPYRCYFTRGEAPGSTYLVYSNPILQLACCWGKPTLISLANMKADGRRKGLKWSSQRGAPLPTEINLSYARLS